MNNQHIREYLLELRNEVMKKVEELATQYDIPKDEVVFLMTTGVYVNDGEQLMMGVCSTANSDVEIEGLLSGMDSILENLYEEPEEGTIDWWLDRLTPPDDEMLN